MTFNGWLQITLYAVLVVLLTKPMGGYMTRVFDGEKTLLSPILRPVEGAFYAIAGVKADRGKASGARRGQGRRHRVGGGLHSAQSDLAQAARGGDDVPRLSPLDARDADGVRRGTKARSRDDRR